MIRLDNVVKHFGGRTLFDGLSWSLDIGRRFGLVGPNGAGKTTLFRILTGDLAADSGRVLRPKDCAIGVLPQEVGDIGSAPLLEFVASGRPDLLALESRIQALAAKLDVADAAGAVPLGHELAEASDAFERLGGYRFRSDAEAILAGMGFKPDRFHRPASELSGGWRVRLVLSRLLLQRPDVLLMDEPTNHLDVPSVEWLEGFLGHYEGTVVVVSHDRYFLNRLVDQIAALEPGGLYVHDGNYDAYLASWDERADLLERMKAKQDREVKELERFVERFRAKATKAKQAQSRLKRLEKMERIETMQTRQQVRRFQFAEAQRAGKDVATVRQVCKAYGPLKVYEGLDLTIRRGERVAVVGPNGAGKSTLLKLLADELVPDSGEVELGHNVQLAYFGQHQVELLDPQRTVLGELEAHAPFEAVPRCRGILGAFLFTGDEVDKKIAVLSGGERNRVALAKLLLRPTNLLLLDEPTNHLDMDSRDVLLEALEAFEGTLVIVSHDRYFINAIATRVLHIEDGKAQSFDGDFEYYHAKSAELREIAESSTAEAQPDEQGAERRKDRKRAEAERRQRLSKALGALPRQREQAEAEIERLEADLERCAAELADPALYASGDGGRIAALNAQRASAQQALDNVYETWTELSEMIEAIEQEHAS